MPITLEKKEYSNPKMAIWTSLPKFVQLIYNCQPILTVFLAQVVLPGHGKGGLL